MKKSIINTLAGLLLVVAGQAWSDNSLITGSWIMSLDLQGQIFQLDLNITEGNDGLTGSISSPEFGSSPISDVKFDGEKLSFRTPDQQGGNVDVSMTLKEGKLSGSLGTQMGDLPATATKS